MQIQQILQKLKENIFLVSVGIFTIAILVLILVFADAGSQIQEPILIESTKAELIPEYSPVKGNPDAEVSVVVFSDFQCPGCGASAPIISALADAYGDNAKFVYRHFPLPSHQFAAGAAQASVIAKNNGKFWEYHDLLFANQDNLTEEDLFKYAETVGLDKEVFMEDFKNGVGRDEVETDFAAAQEYGLQGTPTIILNREIVTFREWLEFEQMLVNAINESLAGVDESTEIEAAAGEVVAPRSPAEEYLYEGEWSEDGIVDISFENGEFLPFEIGGRIGDKVRITNNSLEQIKINQTTDYFDEFVGGVTLDVGDSIELLLTEPGRWTYSEETSEAEGTVYILQ